MPTEQTNLFDVAIVGAGPSGSTCAYYLAGQGKRVLLLEQKEFPRDKLCGDAVCTSAQTHLNRRVGLVFAANAAEELVEVVDDPRRWHGCD